MRIWKVYAGSEKIDIGPAKVCALVTSIPQGENLIKVMWPGLGYLQECLTTDDLSSCILDMWMRS